MARDHRGVYRPVMRASAATAANTSRRYMFEKPKNLIAALGCDVAAQAHGLRHERDAEHHAGDDVRRCSRRRPAPRARVTAAVIAAYDRDLPAGLLRASSPPAASGCRRARSRRGT